MVESIKEGQGEVQRYSRCCAEEGLFRTLNSTSNIDIMEGELREATTRVISASVSTAVVSLILQCHSVIGDWSKYILEGWREKGGEEELVFRSNTRNNPCSFSSLSQWCAITQYSTYYTLGLSKCLFPPELGLAEHHSKQWTVGNHKSLRTYITWSVLVTKGDWDMRPNYYAILLLVKKKDVSKDVSAGKTKP